MAKKITEVARYTDEKLGIDAPITLSTEGYKGPFFICEIDADVFEAPSVEQLKNKIRKAITTSAGFTWTPYIEVSLNGRSNGFDLERKYMAVRKSNGEQLLVEWDVPEAARLKKSSEHWGASFTVPGWDTGYGTLYLPYDEDTWDLLKIYGGTLALFRAMLREAAASTAPLRELDLLFNRLAEVTGGHGSHLLMPMDADTLNDSDLPTKYSAAEIASWKCVHCGCTNERACVVQDSDMGDDPIACGWLEPNLCSNPDCVKKAGLKGNKYMLFNAGSVILAIAGIEVEPEEFEEETFERIEVEQFENHPDPEIDPRHDVPEGRKVAQVPESFEEAATKAGMVVGCLKCVARNQGTLEPKKHHRTCPNRRGYKPTEPLVDTGNGAKVPASYLTAEEKAGQIQGAVDMPGFPCTECGGENGWHKLSCSRSAAARTAEREITHGPGQSEDIDAEHHQEQSAIALELVIDKVPAIYMPIESFGEEMFQQESDRYNRPLPVPQQEATAQELNAVPPEKVDGFDF